jgi:hypothetical protein
MNFINRLLGKTFLVNVHTGEVHNLKNEKKNCGISLISRDHKKYVTKKKAIQLTKPSLDNPQEIFLFNGCRWCMPKEDVDKW